jgi:hypothetical protein
MRRISSPDEDIDEQHIHLFEYDGSNNMIYHGISEPGSIQSAALWQIKKFSYDGAGNLISLLYADGSLGFSKVWNNRAAYAYL